MQINHQIFHIFNLRQISTEQDTCQPDRQVIRQKNLSNCGTRSPNLFHKFSPAYPVNNNKASAREAKKRRGCDKFGQALCTLPPPASSRCSSLSLVPQCGTRSPNLLHKFSPAYPANNNKASAREALLLLVGVTRIELVTPTMST